MCSEYILKVVVKQDKALLLLLLLLPFQWQPEMGHFPRGRVEPC